MAATRLKTTSRCRITSRAIAATCHPAGEEGPGRDESAYSCTMRRCQPCPPSRDGRYSIALGPQVFSQQVLNRIQLRNPALERHPTGAGDLEAIAIRRWLARVRREQSVPAVKRTNSSM